MPRTRFDRRYVKGAAFALKDKQALDISGVNNVLHSLFVVVRGKMTLTAGADANNRLQPGGIHNILKRIIFRFGGYDPSVGMLLAPERRVDIDGKFFGWGGNPAGSPAAVTNLVGPNAYPRISFLNPYDLRQPGLHFVDPDPSVSTEQDFFVEYEIPFYLANGFSPSDLWLDAYNKQVMEVQFETAETAQDIFTSADTTVSFSETNVQVYVNEIQPLDTRTARGGAHESAGYLRHIQQRIEVTGDNPNERQDYALADNLLAEFFVCQKPNAAASPIAFLPDDAILQAIRLERNSNPFYVMPSANSWRAENGRNFGYSAMDVGGNKMATVLTGSGLYVTIPAATTKDERLYLSKTVYVGRLDKSSTRVLDVKKPTAPAGVNGFIDIVSTEFVPNSKFAVLSRRQQVLSDDRRAAAAQMDAETDAIAAVQQNDARSLGAI